MPYCGNQWVAPGTTCPDGSMPTATRGGGPATPTTPQQQVTGKPVKPTAPAQADTSPVVTGMKPPRPGLPAEVYAVSDVYTERQDLNTMRVTDPNRYARIVAELRRTGLLGPRANSESSIDNAYKKLLQAAAGSYAEGAPVTPQQARNILAGGTGAGGEEAGGAGGRGRAYTGPVQSITVAAESDIRATADAVAMEMLGRGVSDQEFQRILKRTRAAEQARPQVTTPGVGRSVTQEGLTAEGRQDIVQNILAKKPEYEEFQKATTLMSWFDRALQERMQQ